MTIAQLSPAQRYARVRWDVNEEEAAERELQTRRVYADRPKLSGEAEWTSSTDPVFDGIYRHLHRAAKEKSRKD